MKIFIVSDVNTFDTYWTDVIELHYASSLEKVMEFLQAALDDRNSGLHEGSEIDISVDYVDEYFHKGAGSLERKTLKEFLDEGLTTP